MRQKLISEGKREYTVNLKFWTSDCEEYVRNQITKYVMRKNWAPRLFTVEDTTFDISRD